jgi:histidine triad (HIT) family protein
VELVVAGTAASTRDVETRYPAGVKKTATTVTYEPAACPFCNIAARVAHARIVFEDAISLAFLDNRPLFPGHCLLIPKQHYTTLYDLPSSLIGPLFSNARILASVVQRAMQADGSFVAMNNIVSQSVPHFHIHIVSRKRGDGLRGFFWPRHKLKDEEATAVHNLIVNALLEAKSDEQKHP